MATRLIIDNQLPDGSSPPPHITIENADFIPNVGDFLEADGLRYVIKKRLFVFSLQGKHGVHLTVSRGE
jgi:hypothetical protein